MTYGAMTGDANLQRYLADQYHYYHDQMGYTKSQAHAAAFQDMLAAKDQGYIVENPQPEEENIYTEVIFSEEEGF
jgi:hypothetical protein